MQLIKFCTNNNNTIKSLQSAELYFNNLGNFNDPFEGIFRFKLWTDKARIEQFYLQHFSGDPSKLRHYVQNPSELEKEINKTFEYRFNNNAVTCFSDTKNIKNILMWSHYANNHAGLCLVFESDQMSFVPGTTLSAKANSEGIIIGSPTGPHKVDYKKDYVNTDPISGNLNQTTFLTTKFNIWSYENEYRFIAPQLGCYHFNEDALKKVIFGLRTRSKYKAQVSNIVRKKYPSTEFYRIRLKDDDFAFELEHEQFVK